MTDVEKYGVFAVVFVGGLLLLIGLTSEGLFGEDPEAAVAAVPARSSTPIVIHVPAPEHGDDATSGPVVRRVRPLVDDRPAFDWSEAPIRYPGSPAAAVSPTPLAGPQAADPAPAIAKPPASEDLPASHTVAKNETLSEIAQRYLGSSARWPEIVALNPGLDPKSLQVGQALVLRGAAPKPADPLVALAPQTSSEKPSPATAAKGRTHVVKKGETLGEIAQQELGSVKRLPDLFAANRDVLRNADDLKVGQVLRIP